MLPQNVGGWLLVGVLALVVAGAALARQVRLELRDGRQITGELVSETDNTVTIEIAGIETTFPRDEVDDVVPVLTLAERYQRRRANVADDDYSSRYQIARWLYDQRTLEGYQLAMQELESLLEDRPSHPQAQLLYEVARERLAREQELQATLQRPQAEPAQPRPRRRERRPELLSEDQITLMKAFEVNLSNRPMVVIPRPVIDELFEEYRADPVLRPFLGREGKARFLRMPGHEQLAVLFELRAREYYDQVIFRTEPETLQTFRMRYHPNYVVRYCGQCHGEQSNMDAPGLDLLTRRPTDEATAYTNLMILRRTEVADRPLIDPSNPEESRLIQYGLPRPEAITPHPEVRGWRPYFNSRRDRHFRGMIEWMRRLYGDGRDYPINFEPPTLRSPEQESLDADDADETEA